MTSPSSTVLADLAAAIWSVDTLAICVVLIVGYLLVQRSK